MDPIYKYSLNCGVLPSKPHIPISFFPMSFDKYIIIENSKQEGTYEHCDEILNYSLNSLKKNQIKVIQIKFSADDQDIRGAIKYQGLSISQMNFLIKNCKALISNSKYTTEVAKCLNVKTISIMNKNLIEKDMPKWYKAPFKNFKKEEFAESISKTLLDFLDIENSLNKVKPFFCGKSFHEKILEIVPNFDPNLLKIENENINVRADYHFEQDYIKGLILKNKVNLITKKIPKINKELARKNLLQINLEVDESTKQETIDKARELNNNLFLFSRDANNIQKIRLNLIDEKISLENKVQKKDLDIANKLCNNTYYKSSKIIISKGKNYTSLAAMKLNQQLNPLNLEKVIDTEEFWEESEHFKLINIQND